MRCPVLLARLAYRAMRPAACVASPLLPAPLHPGKRARRIAVALQMLDIGERFARALLESSWKSALLRRYVSQLQGAQLDAFLEKCVTYDGAIAPEELVNSTRRLVFATPHYGAPMAGTAALSHALRGCEIFHVSPDAFDDIHQTMVVPFFGRLLRVTASTALLALRSNALIVPVFAVPPNELGLHITLGNPIDPARVATEDEAQAVFTLTYLLFSRIEDQLRQAPQHWRGWERLPQVSTPLAAPAQPDNPQLLEALRAKFRALPPAAQDIPELELLLE